MDCRDLCNNVGCCGSNAYKSVRGKLNENSCNRKSEISERNTSDDVQIEKSRRNIKQINVKKYSREFSPC